LEAISLFASLLRKSKIVYIGISPHLAEAGIILGVVVVVV